ncbi:MAG: hypothetical protein WBA74_19615, partial [Cyclobacteriaceae bacterium]
NSYKYYASSDGGQTFSVVDLTLSDPQPINTNISNNGKIIVENVVLDIEEGSVVPILQVSFNLYHFVTESGKLLSFQGRNNEIKLYEINGTDLDEVDIDINFDPFFSAGVSGEKIGFYNYQQNEAWEFDAISYTVAQRSLANVNYSLIGGGPFRAGRTVTAYSAGHFALAKEGGVLVIAPNDEVNHYRYTNGFGNFMNTSFIAMSGEKVFVKLFKSTGEEAVFEGNGNDLSEVPLSFPLVANGDEVIAPGFLENGNRAFGGLIRYNNGTGTYLGGDLQGDGFDVGPAIGLSFEVGNDIYFNNKIYNTVAQTYRTSAISGIRKMLYVDNRHIAYTENGTFQSFDDGGSWESTGNTIQPVYVVQHSDGTWYGMTISYESVNLGNTGFNVDNYGHKVYTSADPAVGWTLLPGSEKSGFRGEPMGLSSDGIIRIIDDIGSGLGNAVLVLKLSRDYGVTYESYDLEGETPDDKTSEFETKDGRKVTIFVSQGIMELTIARLNSDDCAKSEITLPMEISGTREYSVTSEERLLMAGTSLFRSGKL